MFALLFTQISALTSGSLCGLWFDVVNGKCECALKLSSDKTRCAPTCSELGERELNGLCVTQMARKTELTGCSEDDGSKCTKCNIDIGYALVEQSCVLCWELGSGISRKVPNAAGTECVTCNKRHSSIPGDVPLTHLIFNDSAPVKCAGDAANGYAASIPLISTLFAEDLTTCWSDRKVVSDSGTSCVECKVRYTHESDLSIVFDDAVSSTYHCKIAVENGWIGQLDSEKVASGLQLCWELGSGISRKVPNAAGTECVTCNKRHSSIPGDVPLTHLIFNDSAPVKCAGDAANGYAASIPLISTLFAEDLTTCWSDRKVVSDSGTSCVECKVRYTHESDLSIVFDDAVSSTYHCKIAVENGWIGQLDSEKVASGLQLCWELGSGISRKVPNAAGTECVTCNKRHSSIPGDVPLTHLIFNDSAPVKCAGDAANGYAASIPLISTLFAEDLTTCWSDRKVVSDSGTSCVECKVRYTHESDLSIVFDDAVSSTYHCKIAVENGWIGQLDSEKVASGLQLCWELGSGISRKVPNAAGTECVTCNKRHSSIPGDVPLTHLIFNDSAPVKCAGDAANGYAASIPLISTLFAEDLTTCWSDRKVVSDSGTSCVECKVRYTHESDLSIVFDDAVSSTYHCKIAVENGWIGQLDSEKVASGLQLCWELGSGISRKVPNAAGTECVTCNKRHSSIPGDVPLTHLIFNDSAPVKCAGDAANGYAASIPLISTLFAEDLTTCWSDRKVVSDSGTSCVECKVRYTHESDLSIVFDDAVSSTYHCKIAVENGWIGQLDSEKVASGLQLCWELGSGISRKVPNAAGTECVTCNKRHSSIPGDVPLTHLIFNDSAPVKCAGDAANGYAASIPLISTLFAEDLTTCWSDRKVVSDSGTSCVECKVRYTHESDLSIVFDDAVSSTYHCKIAVENGWIGQLDSEKVASGLQLCWELGSGISRKVPNAAGTECVTCNKRHSSIPGDVPLTHLIFNDSAPVKCAGDAANGYAASIPLISTLFAEDLTTCWSDRKVVSDSGTSCVECKVRYTHESDLSIVFDDAVSSTYHCKIAVENGWIGQLDSEKVASGLQLCWELGSGISRKVPNAAGTECVTCNKRHSSIPGDVPLTHLIFNDSAPVKCAGDISKGYAVEITTIDQLVDENMLVLCWATGYVSDGIHCQLCKELMSSHSIFSDSASNKCLCDPSQGFAGQSTVCNINCFGNKQIVQVDGSVCISCDATNSKFQNNMCKCNNGFAGRTCELNCWGSSKLVSNDGMTCVECSFKNGDGSVYDSNGACKCDNLNGFAGTDGVCNDCWKIGLKVAEGGAKCEENCLDDLVRSQDGLSCITCAAKFGAGSIVNQTDKLKCMCDRNQGFAGDADKVCSDCWKLGQEVQAYENLSTYCKPCSEAKVLQGELAQRTCKVCTDTNQVPSTDNMQCISCSAKFGPGSVIKSNNEGTCKCDTNNGFAGTDGVCNDCWKIGLKVAEGGAKCEENCLDDLVRSQDGLSCITCAAKFGAGSIVNQTDKLKCMCDRNQGSREMLTKCVPIAGSQDKSSSV
ncbi:VSP [Hexamita inflata]|uniref:VSP n=1 Tax=Hexamita inflata TaxID=28002 RepID=A0AA86USI1_9EUKA|nr:VSP [Hexamita inflata]